MHYRQISVGLKRTPIHALPAASEGRDLTAQKVKGFKSPFICLSARQTSRHLVSPTEESPPSPCHFHSAFKTADERTHVPFKAPVNLGTEHLVSVLSIFIVDVIIPFLLWDIRKTFLSLMSEQNHPLHV